MIPLRLSLLLLSTLFLPSCTAAKAEAFHNPLLPLKEVGIVFSKRDLKGGDLRKAQHAAKEGVRMMKKHRYKAAIPLFEKALLLVQSVEDYAALATLHLQLAVCSYESKMYPLALYHFELADAYALDVKASQIPQWDRLVKGCLAELTALLYARLGCYYLARQAIQNGKFFFKEIKRGHEKYIVHMDHLLESIQQQIATQKDEHVLSYDFDPDDALLQIPYAPNDFSYLGLLFNWILGIFFGGLALFLAIAIISTRPNPKGEAFKGMVLTCMIFLLAGWLFVARAVTMMVESPQPILLTPTHLLLPFFLKEEEKGILASLFSWPPFSHKGTYYPVTYQQIQQVTMLTLSRNYSVGKGSYFLSYPGLSILTRVEGEIERYTIHSQDCEMTHFKFLHFFILIYYNNQRMHPHNSTSTEGAKPV